MLFIYASTWASLLLKGVALILLGVLVMSGSNPPDAILVVATGVALAANGLHALSVGIRSRHVGLQSWLWLCEGVVSLGLGLFYAFHPDPFAFGPLLLAAFLSFACGAAHFTFGRANDIRSGEPWVPTAMAFTSLGFGILMCWQPVLITLQLTTFMALASLSLGIFSVYVAGRLVLIRRRRRHDMSRDLGLARRISRTAAIANEPRHRVKAETAAASGTKTPALVRSRQGELIPHG